MLTMPAPSTLTSPPMGTRPEPGMLDSEGVILPESFAAWIGALRRAGWTVERIALELGTDERTVWYWAKDKHRPTKAVRRLAWRALWGPLEAEVNGWTQPRHAALQHPTEASDKSRSGRVERHPAVNRAETTPRRVESLPPAPSLDQQMILAWMEAHPGMTEDEARGQLGVA